ncbi:LLM class flavin-dependent oxidoreductase [Plantactinospora mayteni]|uniref:N5,N10-methylene tetrahydromethanopterin reductase n=1 Tax=Plantactinospora mayteni TaxID=566021 RepID=A0ABQ4F166_9ACTN|nr:LLM class flavin-dependent oxidoreductase [Plantactinospora mayteni]GIH00666.1 N5,N10-methylene tetrahydromethanopterin reductase [Plantactinospora mayteni]
MPDHGRTLTFGYFLVPNVDDPLLAIAQEAERRGLDYLGVQDHPYHPRYVESWVLMSMIAASTSRIGLFSDVANLPLRPPATLAKAAASLDVLSGGRFDLGLGAGAYWDAIEAFGGPRRAPKDALAALAESIEIIRLLWSGEGNLRHEGSHYRLAGARSGPVPAHDIGVWLGVYGPRAIELTGRIADGWVPSLRGDLQSILDMSARLDDAAAAAGRNPGAIRRVLNVHGEITGGTAGGSATGGNASGGFVGGLEGMLRGPVERWVDELSQLALGPGFDTFVLWADDYAQLAVYAEEVVPAIRHQVAKERGVGDDARA